MYQLKNKKISIKDIASFLNVEYTKKNFYIETISSLNNIKNNSLLFSSSSYNNKKKINFKKFKNIVIICDIKSKNSFNIPTLISKNQDRLGKELWTDGEDGELVKLSCY